MLLAQAQNAVSGIGTYVGIPTAVASIGFNTYLWLAGVIKRTSDCKDEKDVLIAERDAARSDRDAWKTAHAEEVEARRAAEQSSAALLNQGNVTTVLLETLKLELQRPRVS